MRTEKLDIYGKITNQIIEATEAGADNLCLGRYRRQKEPLGVSSTAYFLPAASPRSKLCR